jgi:hypothetical protein
MAQYQYKIATTYAGLTNLEDIVGLQSAPHHSLIEYSQPTTVGDAAVKSLGWRMTTWHWDFLTQAQYTALKTFCAALSASVYIQTKKNDGTYQIYTAIMHWPTKEPEYESGRLLDITVEFVALAEATS